MTTVLLTHDPEAFSVYYGDAALGALQEMAEVRRNPSGALLDTAALIEAADGCTLIVGDVNTPAEAALFDALPDLVAFHRCAVDRRTLDVASASRNGVLVTNASPGFVSAVAELIFGVTIDLARGVSDAVGSYRAGAIPAQRMGMQLDGATLGVIGHGSIGRRVAELGRAFGMTVLVCDPCASVDATAGRQVDLDELLDASDVVVLLPVANDETRGMMDAARFAAMKPGALFVNAARPILVDEAALADALRSGHLGGAALDVGSAPGMMPPLVLGALPNVVATPHLGGLTPQATQAQALETVEQVRAVLAGRMPHNALNPDSATRLQRFRAGG